MDAYLTAQQQRAEAATAKQAPARSSNVSQATAPTKAVIAKAKVAAPAAKRAKGAK